MMDFAELIQSGWQRHDSDSAALADELEARAPLADDADKAAQFLSLANHTIGMHLGDWTRAAALSERVVDTLQEPDKAGTALSELAIARFMAGDVSGALGTESRAAAVAEVPLASLLRTRVVLSAMLVENGRIEDGAKVYRGIMELARAQNEKLPSDKAVAVTSNNLASALLHKADRGEAENALMHDAAEAALEFWKQAGTWINEERAEYLLALVNNATGDAEQALDHATRGLKLIADNGEEMVDEAFLNLALAHACKLMGNQQGYEGALLRADELAAEWHDEGLKAWYAGERARCLPDA
jgi:hypothetical protein